MNNKEKVITLQSDLMQLANAFVENKWQNKPWEAKKEEFSRFNEQFKILIAQLPSDFYLEETNDEFTNMILTLSIDIKRKIETLKCDKE